MSDLTWTVIGIVAACLTTFGFVPQVTKMWRLRSARDVSGVTMLQMMLGDSLWLLYGVGRRDAIIVSANIIAIAILIAGVVLYYRFRESTG
jgi:MtN3 and saliva related transmembrane protein